MENTILIKPNMQCILHYGNDNFVIPSEDILYSMALIIEIYFNPLLSTNTDVDIDVSNKYKNRKNYIKKLYPEVRDWL
jgi:hypothetical protein